MPLARFTAIDTCGFTLEDRLGFCATFTHPNFEEFVNRAIDLVGLDDAVDDTDQLLYHWFEL